MHAYQLKRWGAIWLAVMVVLAVFVAMGYGLIGVLLLILVGGLVGGALMSYLGGD